MEPRPILDVSDLPASAFDVRAPLWWGNTLMILIETTTVALTIATYFYLHRNYALWPPPNGNVLPPIRNTNPDLLLSTSNTALLLLSLLPAIWIDRSARAGDRTAVVIGLALLFVIGIGANLLRAFGFEAIHFKWYDNAYGSIVWLMLGLHMTYLVAGTMEFFVMLLWLALHPMDEKRALDITLCSAYWYWVVATWVVLYIVIYFTPRVI